MTTRQSLLVALMFGVSSAAVQSADLDPNAVAEDCRMEAEGEGLTGADLEGYVKDCIMTLLQEIDLSETDSKPEDGG